MMKKMMIIIMIMIIIIMIMMIIMRLISCTVGTRPAMVTSTRPSIIQVSLMSF